jgi:hypothetical protein
MRPAEKGVRGKDGTSCPRLSAEETRRAQRGACCNALLSPSNTFNRIGVYTRLRKRKKYFRHPTG